MKTLRSLTVLLAVCFACARAEEAQRYNDWVSDPVCQMIFQAVLDGLYTDGVSNDDVDTIIPIDPKTGQRDFAQHFVYACPLCHPAYEALVAYRARQTEFFGRKMPVNTFGKGLDPSISAALRDGDLYKRRGAIGKLVESWVQRRLESMRLTEAERTDWYGRLAMLRKQGMNALFKGNQLATYKDKGCAVCDACVRGGEKAWSLTSLILPRNAKSKMTAAETPPPPPPAPVKPPKVKEDQF